MRLYGQPGDTSEITIIAGCHGSKVIEDGVRGGRPVDGVKAGALATSGCFSLDATKNIICREGGIVTTDTVPLSSFVSMA